MVLNCDIHDCMWLAGVVSQWKVTRLNPDVQQPHILDLPKTLVVASLLVAGAHCGAVLTYGVPAAYSVVHQPVIHQPVVYQTAVRAPVVAEHKELVHVPHHEYGYSVEQNKVVQPKSTVLHHDPLTGSSTSLGSNSHVSTIMKTLTLVVASLLVAGAHCGAVLTYGVPAAYSVVHQPVIHQPVVYQAAVRAPVVAEHKELVHVPHHEYGYSVEQNKVVQPKSTVLHHDPLTGLPYQQTDYHHAPVVTGSRTYVHHSRPGYVAERTKSYIL
ncbi:hypothetical protein HPB50_025043 [Hyalomma asiaticum]|uniref:Uncharacterized protein n=1 Tax=Hyalomma asiaticum TaxID=266040 RepID=A0ACB7T908_HYAAI|nr:hypothetical protein HPB50_025043 [Hyalomma asiaticum]